MAEEPPLPARHPKAASWLLIDYRLLTLWENQNRLECGEWGQLGLIRVLSRHPTLFRCHPTSDC